MTAKVTWTPYRGEESLAIKQLGEALGIDLTRGRIDDDPRWGGYLGLHHRLHDAIKTLPWKKAEEILLSSSVGATAKILDIVWDAAVPELIGRQLCMVVEKDAPSIQVPKAVTAMVRWLTGGGEVPRSEETYTFVTIEAKKSGCASMISRDAIEDATWDLVARQLAEGARAMAEFESNYIIDRLIANAGNTTTAASSGTLVWDDVAGMIGTMWKGNRKPDVLALNPGEFADLLKDSDILNLLLYKKQEEFVSGGPIAYVPGTKILVSSQVPSGTALLVDSQHAGVLFIRRDITMEDYEDPIEDLQGAVFTERWNFGAVDTAAIATITSA
jgi:HK97 family phage major capsid protein